MFRTPSILALAAGTFAALPAAADLTASEAWDTFQSVYASVGGLTWEDVSESGGTVTVTGAAFNYADDDGSVVVNFGDLVFTETGSGEVTFTLPDTVPFSVEAEAEGETFGMGGAVTTESASIVFSGVPGDIVQTYDVAAMNVSIDEIRDMPEDVPLNIVVSLNTFVGTTTFTDGDVQNSVFNFTAASLDYDIDVVDPSEGKIDADFTMRDIVMSGSGTVPASGLAIAPELLFSNPDYSFDIAFTSSGSALNMEIEDSEGGGNVTMVSGPLDASFESAEGQISYDGSIRETELAMLSPELPLPVNLSIAEYGYDIALPLVPTEDDRDFKLGLTLIGLELDDFLWNLFDPGTVLPREPADLAFLIEAQGRWLIDIMSPDLDAADLDGELPVSPTSAKISNLLLTIAGAQLTGEGEFTFDNEDLFTFDGLPAPTGAVDFKLTGGNGLVDKLVQMGLLPQEQAMGARMVMGLFMVPGAGPDELTSRIEVQGDGQITANGQRLR